MTNFDYLKEEPKFKNFADTAIAAERIFSIDESASILNCRRAMEFAIKWIYSVDGSLVKPWDDKLVSLMSTEEFRDLVDNDLWQRLNFIRKMGNTAALCRDAAGHHLVGDHPGGRASDAPDAGPLGEPCGSAHHR